MSDRDSKPGPKVGAKRGRRGGLFRLLSLAVIWSSFLVAMFLAWCAYDLPGLDRMNALNRRPSVMLLAADGAMIASYGDLYGAHVRLADLPAYLPGAILATEDRRFYYHFGIDLLGLARAVYVNFREGGLVQGGRTITQQLARTCSDAERTLHRQGQELLLALQLERHFTKDQILEPYLNWSISAPGPWGRSGGAQVFPEARARSDAGRGRNAGRSPEGALAVQSAQ
jgi:penicillin-binding protein 1A